MNSLRRYERHSAPVDFKAAGAHAPPPVGNDKHAKTQGGHAAGGTQGRAAAISLSLNVIWIDAALEWRHAAATGRPPSRSRHGQTHGARFEVLGFKGRDEPTNATIADGVGGSARGRAALDVRIRLVP